MSKKESIDNLIDEYNNYRSNIPQVYSDFFQKYIKNLEMQKSIPRKKGNTNFILNNFRDQLINIFSINGFQIDKEVNFIGHRLRIFQEVNAS